MRNIWKDGVMGVVTGDALGCPVQFKSREYVAEHPVTGMRGGGVFKVPAGSWTDDSSLTLALLDSIIQKGSIDLSHIMGSFVDWLDHGAFTPFGYSYDVGGGVMSAVSVYKHCKNPETCGSADEGNNGNGSLMRIMPACLFAFVKQMNDADTVKMIHQVASLTHAHIRSNIACGLYCFMVKAVLAGEGGIRERLQAGLDRGFAYYENAMSDRRNLDCYKRLRNLAQFAEIPVEKIYSSGYVVDTLEAAVWSLITTSTFKEALLKAVNLGEDSDTVGAVTGGLAGLFYGFESIPAEWLDAIQRKDWIEQMCEAPMKTESLCSAGV